jgi:hypothetical protein
MRTGVFWPQEQRSGAAITERFTRFMADLPGLCADTKSASTNDLRRFHVARPTWLDAESSTSAWGRRQLTFFAKP